LNRLLAFRSLVNLASEVGSSATRLTEEAGEDWLEERSEDNLSAIGDGKGHPEDQHELEGVVEGYHGLAAKYRMIGPQLTEPVDSIDKALKDIEEGVCHPILHRDQRWSAQAWRDTYGQPLCIVNLAGGEKSFHRVVARYDEASEINQELGADVEEDEEEVQANKTKEDVDLGHAGLLLEIVERLIFGQLQSARQRLLEYNDTLPTSGFARLMAVCMPPIAHEQGSDMCAHTSLSI
jgi:hypothetical protein